MGHFLVTILGKLCADEIRAWLPWIALRITRIAVWTLPEDQRERYDEEWRGYLNETAGVLSKLVVACGFLCAAVKLRTCQIGVGEFVFYYGVVVPLVCLRLPLLLAMFALSALRSRRCYVVPLVLDLGCRDVAITMNRLPLGLALHLALNPRVSPESLDRSPYHYSIWCSPRSVEVEEFVLTKVLRCDPFLQFGMQHGPLPLGDETSI